MTFQLPELPYARNALTPHISEETLEFHHGKHHLAYVNKLNELTEGTPMAGQSLEELIRSTTGGVFNQAAQVWNHTFYWHSMSPTGGGEPSGNVKAALDAAFGSFANFRDQFSKAAAGQFGSGWAWLVREESGRLAVTTSSNAGNPMTEGKVPLLTCDVWEHAYYIDYRNARPKYIEAWWSLVNWDFVGHNLHK